MDRRLELMRHVDGFYDEHGYFPYNLNTSSFLALRKPLVCWTSDENPFGTDPDEYFQRHLYMGAFPTVPFPRMTIPSCPARPTTVFISTTVRSLMRYEDEPGC